MNRGAGAITKAGGAEVRILHDGMTRAPVFAAESVGHAKKIADWAEAHRDELAAIAQTTTAHGKMTGLVTFVAGTSVFVRLEFDTKDAMGMNMVTIASAKVADDIAKNTGARLIALSGNMCTDKKPAAINGIMGRGRSVVAGIALSHELIEKIFKTDAKTMVEVNYRKNLVGSARPGSMGFNAHAANVVAAMFIACGQDAAHAIDGSTCMTTIDATESGVYVAVTLPSLPGRHGWWRDGGRHPERMFEDPRCCRRRRSPGRQREEVRRNRRRRSPRRGTFAYRSTCRPAPCPGPPGTGTGRETVDKS